MTAGKRWCCLYWKLPNRAKTFAFCSQMRLNNLLVNKFEILWKVKSKKANKKI